MSDCNSHVALNKSQIATNQSSCISYPKEVLSEDRELFKSIVNKLSKLSPEKWMNERAISQLAKYHYTTSAWEVITQIGRTRGVDVRRFTEKYNKYTLEVITSKYAEQNSKTTTDIQYDAIDLLQNPPEPLCMIIEEILPSGLAILASASGIGKSCFALELAISVATGTPAFNHYQTRKGKVLYFSLEDSNVRFYDRLKVLLGERELEPGYLTYQTETTQHFPNLLNTFDKYLRKNPNTLLIIIDLYGHVREEVKSRIDMYHLEQSQIKPIKDFATKHDIAILLITHTNQNEKHEDVFNRIQGSTGVIGTVDTRMLITRKRGQPVAKLHIYGRDVKEADISMEFNYPHWCICEGSKEDSKEVKTTRFSEAKSWVTDYLVAHPDVLSKDLDAVATQAGIKLETLKDAKAALKAEGFLGYAREKDGGHVRLLTQNTEFA